MAYIGVGLDRIQTVEKLDNITFNGGSTYNLTKGSTAFTPIGADHIICSINGVVQFGNFTVSGSTITFTGATLTASDTMDFIFQIGTGVALTPNNGSVTADKLSTAGISAGQVFKVNDAGNGWELGNASSAEVYGFEKYFAPSTINISVTDSGGYFYINGVQQDTLELLEGNTYVFSYPSSHPFALSTTANGSHGGGSEYTTGVTRDTSANTLTYVVPTDAPQLYYYCTSHSNMGGTANTPVPANNALRVRTTNQGVDNITASQYANFDDVLFSASGFTFSLSNGELIATI
jgi:hypothetical protein